MKKLRITVEGKTYEVSVEILDEGNSPGAPAPLAPVASAPIVSASVTAPAAVTAAAKTSEGPGVVASSLTGKVVTIHVTVGQEVTAGQELLTVEAMKMNTPVYATQAGKVAEILVAAGDAVEEGQGLVKLT